MSQVKIVFSNGGWCAPIINRDDGYMENGQGDIVVYTDGASPNNQSKKKGCSGCGIYWGSKLLCPIHYWYVYITYTDCILYTVYMCMIYANFINSRNNQG